MNSFKEALSWLYGTQLYGVKLGLDSMLRLADELGLQLESSAGLAGKHSPSGTPKIIHVAGTNGKGSTCAMIASLCEEAGLKTGLYTSPHLVSFRERIRFNGENISEEAVLEGLTRIRNLASSWNPHPTFFEIVTALALDWFQSFGAEVIVLETGLGGRLDATNVVTPSVSVITSVGLDHQHVLGKSLREIALEKAGIIKPEVPVVTAPQEPEAAQVIEEVAKKRRCLLEKITQPWLGGPLGLTGSIQRWNASLALAAVHSAGVVLSTAEQEAGLRKVQWPGRFQQLNEKLILDGAHNPPAAKALVSIWQETFPNEKASVIFGALDDKDVRSVLEILAPITGEITFVPVQSPRSLAPEQLFQMFSDAASGTVKRTSTSLESALSAQSSGRNLVTGSLYLVGEALAISQNEQQEWSAQ